MRATIKPPSAPRGEPEPTWEIAYLFPAQGAWSEEEYLALDTNRRVEFDKGWLEVLPVPTTTHQLIIKYLMTVLDAFVQKHHLGTVLFAGVRVQVAVGKFREPDVVFMLAEHSDRIGERFWKGADLVMEVVSSDPSDRDRDLVTKRQEYARARIREYWVVDPDRETITVLRLAKGEYIPHGEFRKGQTATSKLLPGFTADVTTVLTPPGSKKRNGSHGRKA